MDGEYHDGRRPTSVEFVRSLEEDLKRRDFTINALAVDARTGALIDFHEGMRHLRQKSICAIGDPALRFSEDALRIVRGCRFACQLGFSIEERTFSSMKELSRNLSRISGERIKSELFKILASDKPSKGIHLLQECSALKIILPELDACKGVEQNGMHRHDVFDHSLLACDAVPKEKPLVRFAALLHDIGKVTAKVDHDGERPTFYRHEVYSTELSKIILDRLHCSNQEQDTVLNLIFHHMFHYSSDWTDGAVRRFVNRIGKTALQDLFDVRKADQIATTGSNDFSHIMLFQKRIADVLSKSDVLTLKDLAVNGNDLSAHGIPKGPEMGIVFQELLDTVLDDPGQNTKDRLLEIARKFYENRMNVRGS